MVREYKCVLLNIVALNEVIYINFQLILNLWAHKIAKRNDKEWFKNSYLNLHFTET